ncbi:MAG: YdeI/OmpD-associated family protein [Thermoanaerobaculia bacterium]
MGTRDPRIDAYIEKSAPFAQPILRHIREIVHEACPDIEETMKWSMPHFDHKGMVCGMAAFKAHCTFGFWKGSLLFEDGAKSDEAMGQMGRLTSVKDLPSKKELVRLIRRAVQLNDDGVKPAKVRPPKPKTDIAPPEELVAALARNAAARETFERFPPSHRREYVEWIAEAKTAPTRQRRIEQAVEWIAEGKQRNWKYMKK